MEKKITSIADELRKSMAVPLNKVKKQMAVKGITDSAKKDRQKVSVKPGTAPAQEILTLIRNFDCSQNTHMLHPRLDIRTVKMLNSLKLASGIEMNRLIAFSVHFLLQQRPEIRNYVKQSLENFEL